MSEKPLTGAFSFGKRVRGAASFARPGAGNLHKEQTQTLCILPVDFVRGMWYNIYVR